MKITTDIAGLDRLTPPGVEVVFISPANTPSRPVRFLKLARHALTSDWLVLNFSLHEVLFLALVLFAWPFHRCRFATLDFFAVAPPPSLLPLIGFALRRVDLLLVYFKDSRRFVKTYGINPERFRYIPFKVNSWELIQTARPTEEDFIFVGGRSRRDFNTLFAAVAPLGYSVKVLTAVESDLLPHGSSLAGLEVPPNVELLYNDSDSSFFVDLLSRCRLAVLPIRADARVQAGIGVYIMAMALGKCVIISRSLGVDDVLPSDHAVFVDPGDPVQLRNSIKHYWTQAQDRNVVAGNAHAYATALGGEDQLRRSVLQAIGVG